MFVGLNPAICAGAKRKCREIERAKCAQGAVDLGVTKAQIERAVGLEQAAAKDVQIAARKCEAVIAAGAAACGAADGDIACIEAKRPS